MDAVAANRAEHLNALEAGYGKRGGATSVPLLCRAYMANRTLS